MNILKALKAEASGLQQQSDTVHAAMRILGMGSKNSGRKKKRSAAARAKMSKAAKLRWKKIKAKDTAKA